MPIRKSQKRRYPCNWKAISHRIRFERAEGRCECVGECGEDHKAASEDYYESHLDGTPVWVPGNARCAAVHGRAIPGNAKRSRFVLTVAHMDHTPENCADANLKAMCQRCHLAYDRELHAKTRAGKTRGTTDD